MSREASMDIETDDTNALIHEDYPLSQSRMGHLVGVSSFFDVPDSLKKRAYRDVAACISALM